MAGCFTVIHSTPEKKLLYAIVEFDSKESAEKVYQDCDNTEYMSSSNLIDLSFVPSDMEFDESDKTEEFHDDVQTGAKEYHPIVLTHSSMSHTAVSSTEMFRIS